MKYVRTTKVTVLGIKIAETEVTTQFAEIKGSPERGGRSLSRTTPVNPDFVTPLLVEAIKRTGSLSPDKFSFETGQDLMVNSDIDTYTGVQGLKKMFNPEGVVKIAFGLAALTNVYDQGNAGLRGAFLLHLRDVVNENWSEQKVAA